MTLIFSVLGSRLSNRITWMDIDGEGRWKWLTVTHSARQNKLFPSPAACMCTHVLMHVSTREHTQTGQTSHIAYYFKGLRNLYSATFLAPETNFMKTIFPRIGVGGGMVSWWLKCITFIVHPISIIIAWAPLSGHQELDPGKLGTPALKDVFVGLLLF